ncbi:cytochrome P450 [Mollisia scopiformis]|uniref:Cytochrome P450 n=1 Tax=Mollisia scopiformis TaxID=149040 RepID=A0A132BC92_MOLSC|nr:cytochrome P450 [Mollisia scopiformis]KUJ09474.1 cytochrome P450 [Mollisia scopiformis]
MDSITTASSQVKGFLGLFLGSPFKFALTLLGLLLWTAIHRLYFSSISHIPGPKLAAITQLYEIYYDVYLGGKFTLHLESLHKQYGPIIRINPWEIHINDPHFYDEIYTTVRPFNKVFEHISWVNLFTAGLATVPHSLHKMRRSAISPLFSKQQIYILQSEIQDRAAKLCNRFLYEYKSTGKAVSLERAFGCYATDVVTHYTFAREYKYLDFPDFIAPTLETARMFAALIHVIRLFPVFRIISQNMPNRLVAFMVPGLGHFFAFQDDMFRQVTDIISGRNQDHVNVSHKTIFHEVLSSNLPPREKLVPRLADEGMVLVLAGFETTRSVLTNTCFYILNDKEVCRKLKAELAAAWPDIENPPTLQELERLPYLTAIIQEGLRLSLGVSFRLPRTSPTPIQYGSYTIPPGAIFSMCQYFVATNSTIFPSPKTFDPTRWLADPITGEMPLAPDGKLLSRYQVSFSRGTRSCVGMNLAYAELHICLANVFRKCELQLFETTVKDIEFNRDYFLPRAHPDSKGVRALVV